MFGLNYVGILISGLGEGSEGAGFYTVSVHKNDNYHESEDDKRKACLVRPVQKGTYDNVYKIGNDYYVNIEGGQYIATGTIVPIGNTVAADWKTTGKVIEDGVGQGSGENEGGSSTGSGSGENESGTSTGNEGSESTGSGSGGNHGGIGTGGNVSGGGSGNGTISKQDIASAVKTALKEGLVEEYDIGKDKLEANKKADESLKSLSDLLSNLLRGAGRFSDPEHANRYGQGVSELDAATSMANTSLGIKAGVWDVFFRKIFSLPNGNGCADFILFEGEIYQVRIGCDKLTTIKSMLFWVMMAVTFWYVFTSLTSLLRKGGD